MSSVEAVLKLSVVSHRLLVNTKGVGLPGKKGYFAPAMINSGQASRVSLPSRLVLVSLQEHFARWVLAKGLGALRCQATYVDRAAGILSSVWRSVGGNTGDGASVLGPRCATQSRMMTS